MLKQIGKKDRPPPDLVAMLLDCHGKIRHFAALARAAGEAVAAPQQIVEACEGAHRYFTEALPLHVADEDESVLPRLHGRDPALDLALAAMRDEHVEHEHTLAAVRVALAAVRDAPDDDDLRKQLAMHAEALARSFTAHLAREEQVIFPALRQLLSEPEQRAIIAELRARRQR